MPLVPSSVSLCHPPLVLSVTQSVILGPLSSLELVLKLPHPPLNPLFFLDPVWWHHVPSQKSGSLPTTSSPTSCDEKFPDSISSTYQVYPLLKKKTHMSIAFIQILLVFHLNGLWTASSFVPLKFAAHTVAKRSSIFKTHNIFHLHTLYLCLVFPWIPRPTREGQCEQLRHCTTLILPVQVCICAVPAPALSFLRSCSLLRLEWSSIIQEAILAL